MINAIPTVRAIESASVVSFAAVARVRGVRRSVVPPARPAGPVGRSVGSGVVFVRSFPPSDRLESGVGRLRAWSEGACVRACVRRCVSVGPSEVRWFVPSRVRYVPTDVCTYVPTYVRRSEAPTDRTSVGTPARQYVHASYTTDGRTR